MTKLPLGVKNMPCLGETAARDGEALSTKSGLLNGNHLKLTCIPHSLNM